jgi:hypothetical protein
MRENRTYGSMRKGQEQSCPLPYFNFCYTVEEVVEVVVRCFFDTTTFVNLKTRLSFWLCLMLLPGLSALLQPWRLLRLLVGVGRLRAAI